MMPAEYSLSDVKSARNHNTFALALSFLGIFIATSMTIAHLTHTTLPCGASSGCEKVAADQSSYLFGIPISVFGLLAYIVLAALAIARSFGIAPRLLSKVGLLISLVGTVISLLLTRHSVVEIKALCVWCLGSAATMSVLFMCHVALVRRKVESLTRSRASIGIPIIFTVFVALGVFATNRIFSHQSPAVVNQAVLNSMPISDLVPTDARSLGSPDAPVTIVEFADLSCEACREMHGKLMTLLEREKRLRLVFHHLPFTFLPGHQLSDQMAVITEGAKSNEEFWKIVSNIYGSSKEKPLSLNRIRDKVLLAKARARVDRDIALANRLKIDETPLYIIVTKDGTRIPARVFELFLKLQDDAVAKHLGIGEAGKLGS